MAARISRIAAASTMSDRRGPSLAWLGGRLSLFRSHLLCRRNASLQSDSSPDTHTPDGISRFSSTSPVNTGRMPQHSRRRAPHPLCIKRTFPWRNLSGLSVGQQFRLPSVTAPSHRSCTYSSKRLVASRSRSYRLVSGNGGNQDSRRTIQLRRLASVGQGHPGILGSLRFRPRCVGKWTAAAKQKKRPT